MPDLEYLTSRQTADLLHVSQFKLARMRMDGSGPPFVKLGHRSVIYRKVDVEAWVDARIYDSTTGTRRLQAIDLEELEL